MQKDAKKRIIIIDEGPDFLQEPEHKKEMVQMPNRHLKPKKRGEQHERR